jgi:hypothetical protein
VSKILLGLLATAALVAACNLLPPPGATSGDLYALNTSAHDAIIRTTEANPFGGSKVAVWFIPAADDGFVASLGDAAKVEVLDAQTCQVLGTLDPIRGRVNAVIKNEGAVDFQGLPADSSSPPPGAFVSTTNCT